MGKLILPDGQTYTVGSVAKARVEKAAAIKALEDQAAEWDRKAFDGTYTLAKEVRAYMTDKAKAARQEAARLRGEAVPEPEARQSRTVTVNMGAVR